eukprot:CAMPEP_0116015422 /NCGR_PEP_ID=MMETSP0321-20121206/6835_1 /TAXON_ID=163516 /ORGANISM="Leptocylindrus danicus var. danicus, Strain B650" /LENGTH=188 /DNA_ID=CAMNT_0003485205 /DNA_START=24 /DNA_END=586 /DNA_ORIENTATION=+
MKSSKSTARRTQQAVRRPLKLVLQHQSRRIPLPTDYSNASSSTTISKVMTDHADILNSILGVTSANNDTKAAPLYNILYLRNRVSSNVWGSTSLQSLLGADCVNGGTFLLNVSIDSQSASTDDSSFSFAAGGNVLGAAAVISGINSANKAASATCTVMSMGAALQLICQHSPVSSKECIVTLSKYVDA